MVAVARGAVLSAANPLLAELCIWHGKLVTPVSLSWSIHRIATPAEEDEPTQIVADTDVDLVDDKVSTGRFAVAWTVPSDATIGRYEVRWTGQMVESDPVLTWRREFEVVAAAGIALRGLILPADVRREGVDKSKISDAELRRRIHEASAFIEKVCGTAFEPRTREIAIDGSGRPVLLLDQPLVGVASITLSDNLVDPTGYRAYVRGTEDNNAWCPMISRVHDLEPALLPFGVVDYTYRIAPNWPKLRQNVVISGWFGYLEPDGSPSGGTPVQIQRACTMLVIRNLAKLTSDAAQEARMRPRLLIEKTREQSYELDKDPRFAAGVGVYTSDPEIDSILELYQRPPYVGFAAV